jgi:hypothetical protein
LPASFSRSPPQEEITMSTETQEHRATAHALDAVVAYISPAAGNEGISWSLSRVTESLFDDSFLAGGDASRFTASGRRGTLHSQQSDALFFSNAPGPSNVVTRVPIQLTFNLNTGTVHLSWTPPAQPPRNISFKVELSKKVSPGQSADTDLFFSADSPSDDAAYTLLLMLI